MRKRPRTPDTLEGIKTEIRMLNMEQEINTAQLDRTLRSIGFGLYLLLASQGLVKITHVRNGKDGIMFDFITTCSGNEKETESKDE